MSVIVDREAQRRRLLFVPCETRAHLASWIREYLGLQFPDCTVSDESNSNPLDMIWNAYDRLRRNDVVGFSRVMSYANRGGFKTLAASVLEVLVVLHMKRNVAHMAAILDQSKKSAQYVKNFFNRPLIRDYKVGDNARGVTVVRYRHQATGDCLPEARWTHLPEADKSRYERIENYIKIVLCTMAGANSEHTELLVIDEVDVIPRQNMAAYDQAQAIADTREGMLPMTLLTSTRKSRVGKVQAELDAAPRTGMQTAHWNIIDITQACTTDRHRPDLPKQTYYINDNDVKHISAEEYAVLNPAEQKKFYAREGYAGCGSCRLFAACKGRLATEQKSKSDMLKPLEDTLAKFKTAPSPEYVTTEYLCRKPDASGVVYPRFSTEVHMKTAAEMAEMITGNPRHGVTDKGGLITLMKTRGVYFGAGMDFGFTHNFSVVTFAIWGNKALVLDCFSQAGLELEDQVQACQYLKDIYGNPVIYPDTAYPGNVKTFSRRGFRVKNWEKKPHSILAGVEIVRSMMWPADGVPRFFLLKGDAGCEYLAEKLSRYRLARDASGAPTEDPEKFEDDECDSLRYGIMNHFGAKGGALKGNQSTLVTNLAPPPQVRGLVQAPGQQQAWMRDLIDQHTGTAPDQPEPQKPQQVKKGKFIWDG